MSNAWSIIATFWRGGSPGPPWPLMSIAATCHAAHQANQCARQNFSCVRNSSRELNHARSAIGMFKKECPKLQEIGSLPLYIEQYFHRGRKRLTRCISDHTERKQRNFMLGTGARDEFRLHIRRIIEANMRRQAAPDARPILSRSSRESINP